MRVARMACFMHEQLWLFYMHACMLSFACMNMGACMLMPKLCSCCLPPCLMCGQKDVLHCIPFSQRCATFRENVTPLEFLCGRQHVVLVTIDVYGTAKDGCMEKINFLSFGCRCVTYPFSMRTFFFPDLGNEHKTKIRTGTLWYTFLCTK